MDKIWAIILAAGASTRMKEQKLLLPFNNSTIIENVISTASQVVRSNIMVVLGSHWEKIARQIMNAGVKTCLNENFTSGMLSSVICGFRSLPDTAEAAIVFLGDQPQISTEVVQKVLDAWMDSQKGIIIPVFCGRRGHPALIETKYKHEIENLDPNIGLRSLYQNFTDDILEVECNSAEILRDIDTPEDYKMEIKLNNL